ncbi:MAG: hypothetical protein AAGD07_02235 [Planctomycetota bacterium]
MILDRSADVTLIGKRFQRQGGVLMCTLVCLGVVLSILLGATVLSLKHRRQLNRVIQLEQTRLVLDAVCDGRPAISDADESTSSWVLQEPFELRVTTKIQEQEDSLQVTVITETMTTVPCRVSRSRTLPLR